MLCCCSFLAQNPADLLRPLGLTEDGRSFPLSPKSERAYTRISHEFDVLFQALQNETDANQSMPVSPALAELPHWPASVKAIIVTCLTSPSRSCL